MGGREIPFEDLPAEFSEAEHPVFEGQDGQPIPSPFVGMSAGEHRREAQRMLTYANIQIGKVKPEPLTMIYLYLHLAEIHALLAQGQEAESADGGDDDKRP